MKLSEYPILESPSAAALVPVIDDGANYTVLLNSLGSSGAGGNSGIYTPEIITLTNAAAQVDFTGLTGTEYELDLIATCSAEGYAKLIVNGDEADSKYVVQDFFSVNGTSVSYRGSGPTVDYIYAGGFAACRIRLRKVTATQLLAEVHGTWYSDSTLQVHRSSVVSSFSSIQSLRYKPNSGLLQPNSTFKLIRIA